MKGSPPNKLRSKYWFKTGRIAEGIGQVAMENGWKSYIVYGGNKRESQSNLIRIGSEKDIILHGLETRLFDRHGLASKKATKELFKCLF